MLEILKTIENSKKRDKYDSCVFELPEDFITANNLPKNSFAILTLQNGKLEAEIFSPSDDDTTEVEAFLAEFGGFNEEMKGLGD
jgi:hypothetical protein